MNDQYLWDRTGEADPDIAELERLLRPLAHDGRPLDLLGTGPSADAGRAAAALCPALALAAAIVLLVDGRRTGRGRPRRHWTVEWIEGTPRVGPPALGGRVAVQPGRRLATDAGCARGSPSKVSERSTSAPDSRVRRARETLRCHPSDASKAAASTPPSRRRPASLRSTRRRRGPSISAAEYTPGRRRERDGRPARHAGLGGAAVEGPRVAGARRRHVRHAGGEGAGHAVLRRRDAGVHRGGVGA